MADFFLGLDSTDSLRRGCTTHVAALLTEKLLKMGADFIDYPHLVRLNPNIPFKTRGNGAISFNFRLDESLQPTLFASAEEIVTREADLTETNSDPGLVFLKDVVPTKVQSFANRCLHDIVSLSEAEDLVAEYAIHARRWKHGRGLIGALAAIGLKLPPDYIFELLAYRDRQNWGKLRRVDPASVRLMDSVTRPNTVNNLDSDTGRVLITPHGPDPVLLGIRGESPEVLLTAFRMIWIFEEVERWVIFRSNECTDSHLQPFESLVQVKPCAPAILRGTIAGKPRIIRGGHVFVDMQDETAAISLAAFEPTGRFRQAIGALVPGDEVIAAGGVKPNLNDRGLALNLESMTVVALKRSVEGNPTCEACGKRMESIGREKGYRCSRCGRQSVNSMKVTYPLERSLVEARTYQPPSRAHRHLTKPLSRAPTMRKADPPMMVPEWCSFIDQPMKILWSSS